MGSDDSGMETILDGEDEEEDRDTHNGQKQGSPPHCTLWLYYIPLEYVACLPYFVFCAIHKSRFLFFCSRSNREDICTRE